MKTPFDRSWWSLDLGRYRPGGPRARTYRFAELPPLDESLFRGEFQWLDAGAPSRAPGRPPAIVAAARRQKLALPPAFVRFFSDAKLPAAVRGWDGCAWEPSTAPIPCIVTPGAFLVRFLRGSADDGVLWYLHLLPDGDAHVVGTGIPFDDPAFADIPPERARDNTLFVAPHFEHFVYRFWIETEARRRLAAEQPLTPEQQAYVEHYAAKAKPTAAKRAAAKTSTAAKTAAAKTAAAKKATKQVAAKTTPARKTTATKAATKRTAARKVAKQKTARK